MPGRSPPPPPPLRARSPRHPAHGPASPPPPPAPRTTRPVPPPRTSPAPARPLPPVGPPTPARFRTSTSGGPGHRWPYFLVPCYAIFELLPPTREWARRLGLVTLQQMVRAMVASIERGPEGVRMIDVPGIRAAGYSANVMERRAS